MADVFISYWTEDRERVRPVANALLAHGWSVWWDRQITPGDPFDQAIERELAAAKSVLVLWSTGSIVAEWVKNEAAAGLARGVLVPALLDPVTPPLAFRMRQTADLVAWDGDPSHEGFQLLCKGLEAKIQAPPVMPKPSPPPSRRRPSWRVLVLAGGAALLAIAGFLWTSEQQGGVVQVQQLPGSGQSQDSTTAPVPVPDAASPLATKATVVLVDSRSRSEETGVMYQALDRSGDFKLSPRPEYGDWLSHAKAIAAEQPAVLVVHWHTFRLQVAAADPAERDRLAEDRLLRWLYEITSLSPATQTVLYSSSFASHDESSSQVGLQKALGRVAVADRLRPRGAALEPSYRVMVDKLRLLPWPRKPQDDDLSALVEAVRQVLRPAAAVAPPAA